MVNINYQPAQRLTQAMAELGFTKEGRVYVNPTTPVVVEFPAAPLSVGEELIQITTHVCIGNRNLPILKQYILSLITVTSTITITDMVV